MDICDWSLMAKRRFPFSTEVVTSGRSVISDSQFLGRRRSCEIYQIDPRGK
jgi:hypothetical protein